MIYAYGGAYFTVTRSVCHRAQEHRGTDPHSSKPSSSPPEHRLLRDFGGCHTETFAIITHSTLISYALTEPGVSFDTLDCTNLYVYITLSPRLNHDGNPALAFIVLKIGILLFDDVNVELREQIELKPQTVKALQEARSEKWGAHLAARGILLVLHVPDLGISVRYDTYIRETRGPTTPDIKDPRLVFAMLKACIAEGLVMKSSIIELEEPRFGRMVKKAKNKNWTWEVVPPSEVDQMVHTGLHVALLRIMIMGY